MVVTNREFFKNVLSSSIPVLFGYGPLGAAFGVLFSQLGYHWAYATLMGVFIFAGAAQFLAVGLLASQAGLLEVFVSTLVLNSRHMFFGLSLLDVYDIKKLKGLYKIFGLTDENYSLVTSAQVSENDRPRFCFWITLVNQSYWVLGCSIGAYLGSRLNLTIKGLDFALTALFVVLALEQLFNRKTYKLFGIAIVIAIVSALFIKEYLLLVSMIASVGFLIINRENRSWILNT